MASGLSLQMVWALIAGSSLHFHQGKLHFWLIRFSPWFVLLLDGSSLDAHSSFGRSSLAFFIGQTLLPNQPYNDNQKLNTKSWPSPKLLHKALLVPAMSKHMHATPHLGRGSRVGRATSAHSQHVIVSQEGYERLVLHSIQQMLDN